MKVYLVKLDWSTEDSNDVDIIVCRHTKKLMKNSRNLLPMK